MDEVVIPPGQELDLGVRLVLGDAGSHGRVLAVQKTQVLGINAQFVALVEEGAGREEEQDGDGGHGTGGRRQPQPDPGLLAARPGGFRSLSGPLTWAGGPPA